jgi:hypothetical protein
MIRDSELAWLSGFWDGEGSIGLSRLRNYYRANLQLSTTDLPTVEYLLDLLGRMGVTNRGYTYQERDPERHQDAHYIRISNLSNIAKMGRLVVPFAITKRRHWILMLEWIDSRTLAAGGLDSKGNVKRGGRHRTGYSSREMEIISELSALNRRGPGGRNAHKQGRITV